MRPSEEAAAAARARGEDPYPGQRFNYLQGTSVPFEPLLRDLEPKQMMAMKGRASSAACQELDRGRFFQEPDRFTLLLFLQADGYDVRRATKRLLTTMVWRQKSGFEDFVDNPNKEAWNLYWRLRPRRMIGYNAQGWPVFTEPLGAFFGSDNGCRAMPMRLWVLCYAFDVSLQQAAFRWSSIAQNRAVHRVAYIGDIAGLRLRQTSGLIGYLRQLTKEVETHFPECAGSVVIFNTSSMFLTLFNNVVKRFLDPRTASTISLHAGVPKKYFLDTFGPELIPAEWGGNSTYVLPRIRPLDEVLSEVGLDGPLDDS